MKRAAARPKAAGGGGRGRGKGATAAATRRRQGRPPKQPAPPQRASTPTTTTTTFSEEAFKKIADNITNYPSHAYLYERSDNNSSNRNLTTVGVGGGVDDEQLSFGGGAGLTQLNGRLIELEKKIAVLLAWIKNQYGEDHEIIQIIKGSLGQPLEEALVLNVGRCSRRSTKPPPFTPPASALVPYPRHAWIPRNVLSPKDYNRSFSQQPPRAKASTAATASPPDQLIILPPHKPRPLDLLDKEMVEVALPGKRPSFDDLWNSDEEAEGAPAAATEETSPFQIISTVSIRQEEFEAQAAGTSAKPPTKISVPGSPLDHYNCGDCDKRFISVRQLAKHSLIHGKSSEGGTAAQLPNGDRHLQPQQEAALPAPSFKKPAKSGKSGYLSSIIPAPPPKKAKVSTSASSSSSTSHKLGSSSSTSHSQSQYRKPAFSSYRATAKKSTARPPPRPPSSSGTSGVTKILLHTTPPPPPPPVPVPCDLCSKILPSRNSLNYHKLMAHSMRKTIFICPGCKRCFTTSEGLKEHQLTCECEEEKPPEPDPEAADEEEDEDDVEEVVHIRPTQRPPRSQSQSPSSAHGQGSSELNHPCAECGKKLANALELMRHLKEHANRKGGSGRRNGSSSSWKKQQHKTLMDSRQGDEGDGEEEDTEENKCRKCGEILRDAFLLRKHIEEEHAADD